MKPEILGLNSYFLMWLVAAVSGVWVATRLTRQAGLPPTRSLVAACVLALAIMAGAKLFFLLEHDLFPANASVAGLATLGERIRFGFRIPGGILLATAVLPLVCRVLRLPALAFIDAAAPAIGLASACARTGCFLNGCCFGRVTSFPLALSFPPNSRVFLWQLDRGLISPLAARSLPVHPAQLYFVALGLALYGLGRRWQKRKRYDGEVWVKFCLVFFGGTFAIELLGPVPLNLNVIASALTVVATLIVDVRARSTQRHARGAR